MLFNSAWLKHWKLYIFWCHAGHMIFLYVLFIQDEMKREKETTKKPRMNTKKLKNKNTLRIKISDSIKSHYSNISILYWFWWIRSRLYKTQRFHLKGHTAYMANNSMHSIVIKRVFRWFAINHLSWWFLCFVEIFFHLNWIYDLFASQF